MKIPTRYLVNLGLAAFLVSPGTAFRTTQDSIPRSIVEGRVSTGSTSQAVVWADGDDPVPAQGPRQASVIDQSGLKFSPHILPVVVGTTVSFLNSDPLDHNVFSASSPRPFNLGLHGSGVVRRVTFDRPGVVEILCNVHPEMAAYVIVLETPYFALTDERGFYQLRDVPLGTYTLSAWAEGHEIHQHRMRVEPGTNRLDLDLTEGSEK